MADQIAIHATMPTRPAIRLTLKIKISRAD
jgi:hypothetical protein